MKLRHSLLIISLLSTFFTGAVVAQEDDPHALDGTELEYTYTDGGSVILTFTLRPAP